MVKDLVFGLPGLESLVETLVALIIYSFPSVTSMEPFTEVVPAKT